MACMIVATGLLAHFLVVLVRFLGRLPAPGPVAPTASAARPPAGRTG
ncbi:MAG: hypothetical protein GTO03_04355, partial [Planctomycetales bacterium]|nr:hypothetical protein [Planctomycetales bacterium]